MKYTVFTVMTPDLTPADLTASLKEYGYSGVEWRCKHVPAEIKGDKPSYWGNNLCTIDPDATDEELDGWLRLTQEQGLEVTAVTPYLTCGDLAATERVLQIASKLGAKTIRVGVPSYDRKTNYNTLYEQATRYLSEVQELCKQYRVKGLVETHHLTISCSAALAHRLVNGFDPDHIGVLYDPGNMVHEGYENYRMGMELLGPYLAHVHVKNAGWVKGERRADGTQEWSTPWMFASEGIVNWQQVIGDLKAVGYDGTIGFEDFSSTYPTKEALQRNIAYIRSLVDANS